MDSMETHSLKNVQTTPLNVLMVILLTTISISTCAWPIAQAQAMLHRTQQRNARLPAQLDLRIGPVRHACLFVQQTKDYSDISLAKYACQVVMQQLKDYMEMPKPIEHVWLLAQHPPNLHSDKTPHLNVWTNAQVPLNSEMLETLTAGVWLIAQVSPRDTLTLWASCACLHALIPISHRSTPTITTEVDVSKHVYHPILETHKQTHAEPSAK